MSHPLAGPIYTAPKVVAPKKMQTGSGAPSFCWECGNQLQRAPGKGLGLFYFNVVRGPDGEQHRIHGDCTERAQVSGCTLVQPPASPPLASPTSPPSATTPSALSAAVVVPGWQPIESAPKELPPGKGVLIYAAGLTCEARPTAEGWGLMNPDFFSWRNPIVPTHWMPLPAAPTPKEKP